MDASCLNGQVLNLGFKILTTNFKFKIVKEHEIDPSAKTKLPKMITAKETQTTKMLTIKWKVSNQVTNQIHRKMKL